LGTAFKMTPAGALSTLVEFTGNGTVNKGAGPRGALVQGSDGNVFGVTSGGGANSSGTIYKMTPDGSLTTLAEFSGRGASSLGKSPDGGLAVDSDGTFYG